MMTSDDLPSGSASETDKHTGVNQDSGIPRELVFPAALAGLFLVIGGFLVFAGVLGTRSQTTDVVASLAISVGLALVLAAFGSRAGGEWGRWSVVGAGALAIILFSLIMYNIKPVFTKTGRIVVDFSKVDYLNIIDDHPLYEYREFETASFQFIVLQAKFVSHCVKVRIYTREKGEGWVIELRGDGDDISKKYMVEDPSSPLLWELDYKRRVVTDGNYGNVVFKEPGQRNEESVISCIKGSKSKQTSSVIPSVFNYSAFAQSIKTGNNNPDVDALIQSLRSNEPAVRRDALDALIASGHAAVMPILEAWRETPANYSLKLGAVMVINNILQNNPDTSSEISSKMSNDDIRLLVNTMSDSDKTVSAQATEILYTIKDKRVVPASVAAVKLNASEDGVFNNVLILKQIFPKLAYWERDPVTADLKNSIPESYIGTRALLRTFDP